jgi:hypothetical protein
LLDLVENLAKRIKQELRRKTGERAHCGVYEDELCRIWPINEKDREKKIAQFASDYGFQLGFYKQGLCAIFLRKTPSENGGAQTWAFSKTRTAQKF